MKKTPLLTEAQKALILGDDAPSNSAVFSRSRAISLWEMIQFHSKKFQALLSALEEAIKFCLDHSGKTADEDLRRKYRDLAINLSNACKAYHFQTALPFCELTYQRLADKFAHPGNPPNVPPRPLSILYEEFCNIHVALLADFKAVQFALIPSENVEYFENDNLFGPEVRAAKDKLLNDEIKSAGDCFALELYTAAVFHLMCAAEHTLRKIADELHVSSVKPGIPICRGTWREVINALGGELKKQTPRNDAVLQRRLERLSEILIQFRAFENYWRNKVMHARIVYNRREALHALEHVRAATQLVFAK